MEEVAFELRLHWNLRQGKGVPTWTQPEPRPGGTKAEGGSGGVADRLVKPEVKRLFLVLPEAEGLVYLCQLQGRGSVGGLRSFWNSRGISLGRG